MVESTGSSDRQAEMVKSLARSLKKMGDETAFQEEYLQE